MQIDKEVLTIINEDANASIEKVEYEKLDTFEPKVRKYLIDKIENAINGVQVDGLFDALQSLMSEIRDISWSVEQIKGYEKGKQKEYKEYPNEIEQIDAWYNKSIKDREDQINKMMEE